MTSAQKREWISFKNVIEQILRNDKSPDWKKEVSGMVDSFQKLKVLMSLKFHFIDIHAEYFPEIFGDYRKEQGKRFHQDIKVIEQRYQGRWDENTMTTVRCWKEMHLRKKVWKKKCHYEGLSNAKECVIIKKIAVLSYSHRILTLIWPKNQIQCLERHYNLI